MPWVLPCCSDPAVNDVVVEAVAVRPAASISVRQQQSGWTRHWLSIPGTGRC